MKRKLGLLKRFAFGAILAVVVAVGIIGFMHSNFASSNNEGAYQGTIKQEQTIAYAKAATSSDASTNANENNNSDNQNPKDDKVGLIISGVTVALVVISVGVAAIIIVKKKKKNKKEEK